MGENDPAALDKRHLWHPFTDMASWLKSEPLIIESGKGATLTDIEGKTYIDGVSSLWTNVHGHQVAAIDNAVKDQLGKIAHSTLLGLANVPAVEFAAKLAPWLPGDLERIFYSDSGATAVEIAVKLAFCHWQHQGKEGKRTFIRFAGAYHGDTIGSVSVGGIEQFHEIFRPLLFDAPIAPYPFCRQCPLDLSEDTCDRECFGEVEKVIVENADRCAAVIIEPLVQGASGIRPAAGGFLKLLREICDKQGLLLIADEVATGFGRTGTMFACEQEDVVPDIMAMAKGISGGYLPLAATAVSEGVFESFIQGGEQSRTFFHGHTYTGNPLACAAASASLGIFDDENVVEQLGPKIKLLETHLAGLASHTQVGHVRNVGMMCGIELVKDKATDTAYDPDEKTGAKVCTEARKHGVILRPLGDVVVIMPPLCITGDQIESIFDGFENSLEIL